MGCPNSQSGNTRHRVSNALCCLQAADFFADERAVQDFAQLLSDRMFPPEELDGTNPEQQQQPPPKKQKTEPYQEHACWDSLQEQKVHNEQVCTRHQNK